VEKFIPIYICNKTFYEGEKNFLGVYICCSVHLISININQEQTQITINKAINIAFMKTWLHNKLKEIDNILLSDNILDYEYFLGQRDIVLELLSYIDNNSF
jgi:hypothetical protein